MKAVYYCRVSTEEESQVNALENQIQESKNTINKNGWIEVDGYIDEGKSGTQVRTRDEYIRLVNDMETNKFDIIVIKSQDRLMRNVKDWYTFVDKLVTYNKQLYFYMDNKYYTPDDALITGIKAILAEEYSRELSKKINNAHMNRQIKGNSFVITNATWGYDKVNKQVVINEQEAEIIRLIYDLYIQGYGSRSISKELSNRGIKSRTGKDFAEVTVRKIIRNPLFKGTVVMNQRHKDFNTKKTIHNPQEEWFVHENAVPAIVSAEIWEKANKIMDSKSKVVHGKEFSEKRIGKNLGKYELSSKIVCGECGSVYWRRYRKNTKGDQIVDWSCSEYVKRGRKKIQDSRGKENVKIVCKDGGCDNIHIKELDLNYILLQVANDFFENNSNAIIENAISILRKIFSPDQILDEKTQINLEKANLISKKDLLLDRLLDETITSEDYKRKDSELEEKLSNILQKEEKTNERYKQSSSLEERILDIKMFLNKVGNDKLNLIKLIDHIVKIVVNKDNIEIQLDFYNPLIIELSKYGLKKFEKDFQYVASGKNLATIDD